MESSRASVLINGSPHDEFGMEQGLCQGDLIAPFLFLVVAEGQNGLLKQATNLNLFTGYKFGRSEEIEVSILQFADDTLIIGDASRQNAFTLKCVLRWFELASGLKINFHKSKLIGIAVEQRELQVLAAILNFRILTTPFSYLGLQVGGSPRRLAFWDSILAKLRGRLTVWRSKNLSFGGRICLINNILSSIPLYHLSFFKMPIGVIKESRKIIRDFLWGGLEGQKKLAWVKWETCCKPKDQGGLGIKDWAIFNVALLGK